MENRGHRSASSRRPGRGAARVTWALIAFGAIAAGCSGAAPEFDLHGMGVVVRSSAAFTQRDDFPSHVENTIDVALQYWGGSWSHLSGKSVIFMGARTVQCAGHESAVGCYDGDVHVSTQDGGVDLGCVEATVLVHEIGHAIIGDPDHADPRWMDFGSVTSQLQTAASGEGSCHIVVNMWRRPTGT